jgi:hypothetical protein
MNGFIARYHGRLNGVLSGFDRRVFRGTLPLNHEAGMKGYLWAQDFQSAAVYQAAPRDSRW